MTLRIGDTAPDFEAETTDGQIKFHDWGGDSWVILFSHPKDFTPVCTTELGYMAGSSRSSTSATPRSSASASIPSGTTSAGPRTSRRPAASVNYPMIGDRDLAVAKLYNMLPADAGDSSEGRTPVDNATVRNVFVVGPDKKIKLIIAYPMSTGRNFDEILRVLDSIQLTAKHQVATPVNWQKGEEVIIVPAVSDEAAKEKYPGGWKAPKPYLRIVPEPKD